MWCRVYHDRSLQDPKGHPTPLCLGLAALAVQVEGVKFLYEATQGLRAAGMHGCILADEMVSCRLVTHPATKKFKQGGGGKERCAACMRGTARSSGLHSRWLHPV